MNLHMHAIYNNTHNTYRNESNHSKMGPVRQNPIQTTVRSVHNVCASHCAQSLHTILHRTDLIVFPLTLQTITTSPMMSIWGKGHPCKFQRVSRLGSVTARHSSRASAKLCGVEQRAPPIFGRAFITLGIGPHASLTSFWPLRLSKMFKRKNV